MNENEIVANYLSSVKLRLKNEGFRIADNVSYKGHIFICVARRTKFHFEYTCFAEFLFIFGEFSFFEVTMLKEFSTMCFKYAIESKSMPLPRGLFMNVFCFPVALVNGVDYSTIEAIRNGSPPKHWAATEMPVIWDLSTKQLYYFEKTPIFGKHLWEDFREIILKMLSP